MYIHAIYIYYPIILKQLSLFGAARVRTTEREALLKKLIQGSFDQHSRAWNERKSRHVDVNVAGEEEGSEHPNCMIFSDVSQEDFLDFAKGLWGIGGGLGAGTQ